MPDLTLEQVRDALAALGLRPGEDDIADVAFRINATLERVRDLDRVELDETYFLSDKDLRNA
ncbi:MAG TPA: hypothetical protein VGG22_08170 [Candidatus Baltobacteraceae bacterium]|jgi:hypothetical protein